MRLFCSLFLLLSLSIVSFAQDSRNYLQVNVNTGLNFNINDPNELLTQQVLYNAFKFEIRNRDRDCTVTVKLHSYNTSSGYYPSVSPLQVQHQSNNSPKISYINTQPVTVSTNDEVLFVKGKNGGKHSFFYNMILAPLGYDFPPGNYNFTLMFTMTPQ